MAKYIDADALLQNLKKQYGEDLGWQCTVNMSDVGMMIEDAPTADVVEVVRCRECRHCNHLHDEFDNDWYFCTLTINNAEVQGDWYCCRGERRTDNEQGI